MRNFAKYLPLSEDQIATALFLRKQTRYPNQKRFVNWRSVADKMGITYYRILQHFEPDALERDRLKRREKYGFGARVGYTYVKPVEPPPQVWAERERAMMEERSLGAVAFGDPPYSRSALGKRNGARQEA